jgi:hypothetical protein
VIRWLRIRSMARVALAASLLVCGLSAPTPRAQAQQRAAVVIMLGDGQTIVRTAEPYEGMTGLDLLRSSGLPVITERGAVCKVGLAGCSPPAQACFCQPQYWGYWHHNASGWAFATQGAGAYAVTPGSIDGWRWGSGAPPDPIDPQAIFDAQRLAPGLPALTTAGGALEVRVDVQGDTNQNAQVIMHWRRAGQPWPTEGLPLQRDEQEFVGAATPPPSGGAYEVRLTCLDPDGINGSSTWIMTTTLPTMHMLFWPLVIAPDA